MDIHVWCEHNGHIIDPYFEDYDMIREIRKCHGIQHHKEQPEHRGLIMPTIRAIIKVTKQQNGVTTEEILSEYAAKPQYGYCFLNAYAYAHAHRNDPNGAPRLCIGKMGWVRDDGSIWWEFG